MDKRAIEERFTNLALRIAQANYLLEVIVDSPISSTDPACTRRRNAFFDLLFDVLKLADEEVEALSPAVNALLFDQTDSSL